MAILNTNRLTMAEMETLMTFLSNLYSGRDTRFAKAVDLQNEVESRKAADEVLSARIDKKT
mgnify:CR=1 FL=1